MADETAQSSLLGKIAAYTEILEKDPNSTIFVSLSEAYRKLGCLDDARQIIEEGLDRHPDFSPAYVVLARILCQQSLYEESRSAFSKALEYDENSLAGLVGFARLSVLMDEVEQARNLLLKARSLSPADPVINKFLNSLPPVPEKPEETPQKEEVVSTPLISETLADLYLKQGLPDKALEIFRELLRNNPDNLELRRRIRDAEIMIQGEVEQAAPETIQQEPVDEETEEVPEQTAEPVQESTFIPETEVVFTSDAKDVEEERQETASTPLDVFNRWLENIQKRRSNV